METSAKKPLGGFVFISATALIAAWWAYKRRFIDYRDFRVWLSCHELVAKRCGSKEGRAPRFDHREVHRLVGGVGGEHVRASLRRLEDSGLFRWRESSIRFLTSASEVRVGEPSDLMAAVESVTNHRRKIPVPRRLLRFLAGCSRPVVTATALGHLLRCMYYRNGKCSPSGLCKASWIASVFEVDERTVKAARQELLRLGVLIREPASQYRLNRWGVPMRFDLAWGGEENPRGSPPRTVQSTTQSPPPRETGNSSSRRSENQKPGAPGPSGVRMRTGRGPKLSNVLEVDLREPRRTLILHAEAMRRGWVNGSEADRLKVLAAGQHALRHGQRNPAGLFVTLLKRGLWHFLSLEDEDKARRGWMLMDHGIVMNRAARAAQCYSDSFNC